jgi:hypothetical protein
MEEWIYSRMKIFVRPEDCIHDGRNYFFEWLSYINFYTRTVIDVLLSIEIGYIINYLHLYFLQTTKLQNYETVN